MKSKMPQKYAILIGINRYHESLGSLKYAVNDCRRLGEVLAQGEEGYPSDHILLITDDQPEDRRPTYANIHSWLASWLSQPKEDDTLFVYFSGHGRELGGKCYLVPADATLQTLHVTGIPVGYIQDLLFRCKARQKILILDACHSGAGKDVATMSGAMLDQIAAGTGIYTITSCDAGELSYEWDERKQGVFSYYLAEALSGACPPDAQGRVTAEVLYEWVYERVRAWAAQKRCTQSPKRFAEGTGIVTLRTGEPDWKKTAHELQKLLAQSEKDLAAVRDELQRERTKADAVRRVTERAQRFVRERDGKWTRKEWLAFLKECRGDAVANVLNEPDIGRILENERDAWVAILKAKSTAQEQAAEKVHDLEKALTSAEKALAEARKENAALRARIQPRTKRRKLAVLILGTLLVWSFWSFRAALPVVGPLLTAGYQHSLDAAKGWADLGEFKRAYEIGTKLETSLRGAYTPSLRHIHSAIVAELGSRILPQYYQLEYEEMLAEVNAGNIDAAYSRGQAILADLLHCKEPSLAMLREQVRKKFETEIVPAYYQSKGFWIDDGKLLAWDASSRQVRVLASYRSIEQLVQSPDKAKLAVVVNGQKEVYVMNADGSCPSRVAYESFPYWVNGWVSSDSLSISSRDGRRAVVKINEVNAVARKGLLDILVGL